MIGKYGAALNAKDHGAFIAFNNSALLCSHPVHFHDFYVNEMIGNDTCPTEKLPFEYPEWNDKWFNPACTNWFNLQRNNTYNGVITNLYQFADDEEKSLT